MYQFSAAKWLCADTSLGGDRVPHDIHLLSVLPLGHFVLLLFLIALHHVLPCATLLDISLHACMR
jgi:hypothetical protein